MSRGGTSYPVYGVSLNMLDGQSYRRNVHVHEKHDNKNRLYHKHNGKHDIKTAIKTCTLKIVQIQL